MNLTKKLKETADNLSIKLKKFMIVKDMPEPLKSELSQMYKSDEVWLKVAATLINGVFTSGKINFTLSQNLLHDYLWADRKNQKRRQVDWQAYRQALAILCETGLFEIVTEASRPGGKGPKRAAWMRLVYPDLLQIVVAKHGEAHIKNQQEIFESQYSENPLPDIEYDEDGNSIVPESDYDEDGPHYSS